MFHTFFKKGRKDYTENNLTLYSNIMTQILLWDMLKHKKDSFTRSKSCLTSDLI